MELYDRYKDRSRSAAKELIRKHYRGYIPHLTILGADRRVLYDQAGEVETARLAEVLDRAPAEVAGPGQACAARDRAAPERQTRKRRYSLLFLWGRRESKPRGLCLA